MTAHTSLAATARPSRGRAPSSRGAKDGPTTAHSVKHTATTVATTRLLSPLHAARGVTADALAHAIHGLLLFVALVGATSVADYPAWRMLSVSVAGIVLFFMALVYSAVLASTNVAAAPSPQIAAGVRLSARRAAPLLEACIAPVIPLLLASIGVVPVAWAYGISLTLAILTLALTGFLALRNRGKGVVLSIVAAAATSGFGAAIIAAETFLH